MNTQSIALKVDQSLLSWQTHAPEKKYLGLTLEEARVILAPVHTIRDQLAVADNTYAGLLASRVTVDGEAVSFLKRLVYAVLSEVGGENSPMYRGMGFVTDDERASGLTRVSDTTESAATDASPATASQPAQ